MGLTLTARDLDLLHVLTLCVRLLTVQQVTRLWWPESVSHRAARRRLEWLQDSRLVELHRLMAHPLLPVNEPMFAWQPGDTEPDCERLAEACSARWTRPDVAITACVAAPRAASLFGSTARGLPQRQHLNHDLRLASVFESIRLRDPRMAAMWIGEHGLPKAGHRIKDPDAFLCRNDGLLIRVMESAGRYSAAQIQSFHDHCEVHELPYELW